MPRFATIAWKPELKWLGAKLATTIGEIHCITGKISTLEILCIIISMREVNNV
jgi:hypothetical protein